MIGRRSPRRHYLREPVVDELREVVMAEVCAAGRRVFMREPDGTWPAPDKPCTEVAVKAFRMVTPGEGRYEFVEYFCGWHEIEFMAHFPPLHDEPFEPQ